MADLSAPAGTWYLLDNGQPMSIVVAPAGDGFTGTTGTGEMLDSFAWDPATRGLQFRRVGSGWWQWYRATIAYGVLAGRFSHQGTSAQPAIAAYAFHVTGWNSTYWDASTTARVWDCITNVNYRCRIAIDRLPSGTWAGTFKCYASISDGIATEMLEEDLTAVSWDGHTLRFTRPLAGQMYTATASGNAISGTFNQNGQGSWPWSGTRSEILGHGLAPMDAAARAAWQERARGALTLLMMAGAPLPGNSTLQVLRSGVAPIAVSAYPPNRDDDPERHPPNYRLTELAWTHTLANPYGGAVVTRLAHGYLAVPDGLQPGEARPAVLAVNGHGGSAYACLDGASAPFWYGDGWARRGYVVLAIDVSHRNDSPLYSDVPNGDDAAHGNGPHPSIRYAPFADSDWEEYGERTWDVMRAMDYLISRPEVDSGRVILTGLSMGGCLAAHAGALDPRFAAVIPAGHSPDFSVEWANPHDHVCYRFAWANFREYYECSDLHALIAPRPLIVQTGRQDVVYSSFNPPYAGDKQVMRRSASAYSDAPDRLVHYLHYDGHAYHFGDFAPGRQPPAGFQNGLQAARVTAPAASGSQGWQTDASTRTETLFDLMDRLLAP